MNTYEAFKKLHQQPAPLILGNVWNAQSATIFEKNGFHAIGTSSAAMAHSLGYADGQQLPFDTLLMIVQRIRKQTSLPLSVDIESGYGPDPAGIAENIRRLSEMGVAGINIEDSVIDEGLRFQREPDAFAALLSEIRQELNRRGTAVFMNVRCDSFLLNHPEALQDAKTRLKLYESAGADGIFLPGIINPEEIKTAVFTTRLPLNVMCMPGLPGFATLAEIGVKRISMGNFLNEYVYAFLDKTTAVIMKNQSFNKIFEQ